MKHNRQAISSSAILTCYVNSIDRTALYIHLNKKRFNRSHQMGDMPLQKFPIHFLWRSHLKCTFEVNKSTNRWLKPDKCCAQAHHVIIHNNLFFSWILFCTNVTKWLLQDASKCIGIVTTAEILYGILQAHFAKWPFFLSFSFKVVPHIHNNYNTYFGFKLLHHKTKIAWFFAKILFL